MRRIFGILVILLTLNACSGSNLLTLSAGTDDFAVALGWSPGSGTGGAVSVTNEYGYEVTLSALTLHLQELRLLAGGEAECEQVDDFIAPLSVTYNGLTEQTALLDTISYGDKAYCQYQLKFGPGEAIETSLQAHAGHEHEEEGEPEGETLPAEPDIAGFNPSAHSFILKGHWQRDAEQGDFIIKTQEVLRVEREFVVAEAGVTQAHPLHFHGDEKNLSVAWRLDPAKLLRKIDFMKMNESAQLSQVIANWPAAVEQVLTED